MKGCRFIFRRQLWHLVLVVRKCYPQLVQQDPASQHTLPILLLLAQDV